MSKTTSCLQCLLCCCERIALGIQKSLWDLAGRKQALHSLSLGLGSVSSAVVPRSFVLKRCSLKANAFEFISGIQMKNFFSYFFFSSHKRMVKL